MKYYATNVFIIIKDGQAWSDNILGTLGIQTVEENNIPGIEKTKNNKNLNDIRRMDENFEISEPENDVSENVLNV